MVQNVDENLYRDKEREVSVFMRGEQWDMMPIVHMFISIPFVYSFAIIFPSNLVGYHTRTFIKR